MKIVQAGVEDAQEISELIAPLLRKYILPTCTAQGSEILLSSMDANSIAKYIQSGFVYHKGVEQEQLMGIVGMRDNSHLYHLFVTEAYHGKGLATLLWNRAKAQCCADGNKGEFTVNSAINAVGLYRKLGFSQVSGIRERFGIKDVPMQLVLTGTA